jgi:hypothetical protein
MNDERLMRNALAHLNILNVRLDEAKIREGTGHKDMSGLLDLRARKPLV